jgi:orotate phosphoribosyltransferase
MLEKFNDMISDIVRLRRLLTRNSFKYSEEPIFKLVSGEMSKFYIDCKMTTLLSTGLDLVSKVVFEKIKTLKIRGIGGLTLGADPIAISTAMLAGQKNIEMIPFVIRKKPKKHGTMKWIEGDIKPGDRVVILDDVITTGGSVIQAIDRAEKEELDIVKVIVLVDREEGGRENVNDRGYEVEPVFTKSALLSDYQMGYEIGF